jgi:hypothetical protein
MIIARRLEIKTKDGKTVIIPQSDLFPDSVDFSATRYVDECNISFNDTPHNVFKDFEVNCEVRFLVSSENSTNEKEMFVGLADEVHLDFDNSKGMRIVRFKARSFSKVLTEPNLEQEELIYKNGYGEVVKRLLLPFQLFDVNGVVEEQLEGRVFFDKISVLDAIRNLAYVRGWCLRFEGRSVFFEPCKPLKHSGLTLSAENVVSGTISKVLE